MVNTEMSGSEMIANILSTFNFFLQLDCRSHLHFLRLVKQLQRISYGDHSRIVKRRSRRENLLHFVYKYIYNCTIHSVS